MAFLIRKGRIVALALAFALAVPAFGAGQAWAQNELTAGDTLDVDGGDAGPLGRGNDANWTGRLDLTPTGAVNPTLPTTYVGAITLTGGKGSTAGFDGGNATITMQSGLYTGTTTTGTVAAGVDAVGPVNAGRSGDIVLRVDGDYFNSLAAASNALLFTAAGPAGDGDGSGSGDGGNLGDISVNISGRTVLLAAPTDSYVSGGNAGGNVIFGALSGGDGALVPNSGAGGRGGLTLVSFGGGGVFGGGFTMVSGDGGLGRGGNGGNGGESALAFGAEAELGGAFTLAGGAGGNTVAGGTGHGGHGGDISLTHAGNLVFHGDTTSAARAAGNAQDYLLAAGNAGSALGGASGSGGNGASITATYGGSVTLERGDSVKMAGDAGNAGEANAPLFTIINGASGHGGHGGSLTISYGGLYTSLNFNGDTDGLTDTIATGDGGAAWGSGNGGQGGAITEDYYNGYQIGASAAADGGARTLGIVTGDGGDSGNLGTPRGLIGTAVSATGAGGDGGGYTATISGAALLYGPMNVNTGFGGDGSNGEAAAKGGDGGRGGDVRYDVTGSLSVRDSNVLNNGNLTVVTGDGGWGGESGASGAGAGTGGRGGDFLLAVAGNGARVETDALLMAGDGGNSGDIEGGRGGDITNNFGMGLNRASDALTAGHDVGDLYTVLAGDGGAADGDGIGGRGGHVAELYHGIASYMSGSFAAGGGGDAVSGSNDGGVGGAGGNVLLTWMSDAVVQGHAFGFLAGAGGDAAAALSNTAGDGGAGGTVTATVARDLLGTAAADTGLAISAGDGGDNGNAQAGGDAGNGGAAALTVARDLMFAGGTEGAAGNGGILPAGAGRSGHGGDLNVFVGRIYGSGGDTAYTAGNAGQARSANPNPLGWASADADGAAGGDVTLEVGVFQVAGAGSFLAGDAGRGHTGHTGGQGGDITVAVYGRAAYFGEGLKVAAGNAETANGGHSGLAGNARFTAQGGYVVSQGGFSLSGGDGMLGSDKNGGLAGFDAYSLALTNGLNAAGVDGLISGSNTILPAGAAGDHDVNAGSARFSTTFLRTDYGTGFDLDIHRNYGHVDVNAQNVAAVGERFSLDLNRNGPDGNYTVTFGHLGISNSGGSDGLKIHSADTQRLFNWTGDLYSANAPVPGPNMLTVTKLDPASDVIYDQVDMSGRTVAIDVANLRDEPPSVDFDIRQQLLDVNGNTSESGHGVLTNTATRLNLLGADNLRFGQTVKLFNLADGAAIATHSGAGQIGDTYGNLADAAYTLASRADSAGKNYATLAIDSFSIRNDWVIDNSRDLATDAATDFRSLSVPGALRIVDNRYFGADDIGLVVDDQGGTRGTANLWASTISVETTNSVSRDWAEDPAQRTATTFDFTGALAGNVNNRNVRGAAFDELAIKSGSHLVLNGGMGAVGQAGAGNYAFGGRLVVGEMFRPDHTSARLTNDAATAGEALKINRLTVHLANDLASRINWLSQTAAGGAAALEVIGGQAPIVHFDHIRSVEMSLSLASLDAMETARKNFSAPRFALIDRINGGLSTIGGQTFAQNGNARLAARSWAGRGFLEGLYELGYGSGGGSVVADYRGLSADLGQSALQARSGAELLLGQGQDLIVDLMGNSRPVGGYDPAEGFRTVALGAMSGGYRSVKTGSDVSGAAFSAAAGPGLSRDCDDGRTTLGFLLEAGWGDFDLNNYFAWRGGFDADAESSYYGAALAARHEYFSGLYGEASVRAGVVDTDYTGHQSRTGFSTDSMYLGGHVGAGYQFDAWPDGMVDLYAKGLFTFMDGDDTDNTAGEHLKLDSSTSVRSRLGARFSHNFKPELRGYVGGAWEYEFDGEQKGAIGLSGSSNAATTSIDTKGHTGLGELGVEWAAGQDLTVGAGFQGAFGQREGCGGALRLTYSW